MEHIIQLIIKNYKRYTKQIFDFPKNNYIFIGENDSGKSTILEALDLFFNYEKLDKVYANNPNENIEIHVLIEKDEEKILHCKKVFKKGTFKYDALLSENMNLFDMQYIYINPLNAAVDSIIKDLAVKKAIENLGKDYTERLNEELDKSVKEVIGNLDEDLIVVNPSIETKIYDEVGIKLEKAFEVKINSTGMPIECRGLGYRRNLIYALVAQSNYENTVIGIDEIENSISLHNVKDLLEKVAQNFPQSFITTHSTSVLAFNTTHDVYPIFDESNFESVADMYAKLGVINGPKTILLVEGLKDLNWYNRVLALLNLVQNYIVVSVNGKDCFDKFAKFYMEHGIKYKIISDGDDKKSYSIKKDCVELYAPVTAINKLFGKQLSKLSSNKNDFFGKDLEGISEKVVKDRLSNHVNEFLQVDNPLVEEIRYLLNQ